MSGSVLMKSRNANSDRCMPSMKARSTGTPSKWASGSSPSEEIVACRPDQLDVAVDRLVDLEVGVHTYRSGARKRHAGARVDPDLQIGPRARPLVKPEEQLVAAHRRLGVGHKRVGRLPDRGLRGGLAASETAAWAFEVERALAAGRFGGSIVSFLASARRALRSALRILFVRSRPMADSSVEATVLRIPMRAPGGGNVRVTVASLRAVLKC